jgi:hypothetical protein
MSPRTPGAWVGVGGRIALAGALAWATTASAAPGRWLDRPPWPATNRGDRIELTWLVYPIPPPADTPANTRSPLALEITIGGVTRVQTFPPQLGELSPLNLPLCASAVNLVAYPLARDEVAKITFYEGGAGGFVVKRAGGDVLAVFGWEQSDGACEAKGHVTTCPRRDKLVTKLHVPPGLEIRERIFELDAKGARHAFDCTP